MAQLVLFVHFSLQLAYAPFERAEDSRTSFNPKLKPNPDPNPNPNSNQENRPSFNLTLTLTPTLTPTLTLTRTTGSPSSRC